MEQETIIALKRAAGTTPYERRLHLDRSGREWTGFCPWHEQDKRGSPSLHIFEDKRNDGAYSFKCMAGCAGKEGDVLKFVQLVDGIGFGAALKVVETEVGFKAPEEKPYMYDADKSETALRNSPGALEYLAGRGIDKDAAEAAKLGLVDHPVLGSSIAIPYGDGVIKFRAIHPVDKNMKFRHLTDKPSKDLLYGIDRVDFFDDRVYVTESELDCLTMRAHGFSAVSVSSASTCLHDGKLIIRRELLDVLGKVDKIMLVLDQDKAGQECAAAFKAYFPKWQVVELKWDATYDKDDHEVPLKDVGELYTLSPIDFRSNIEALTKEAFERPPEWRELFKSVGELQDGGLQWVIEGFMPEGITMIGALAGEGKTNFALSMSKSIATGAPFIDKFPVTKPTPVLYMNPESGGAPFKQRCQNFRIPNDESKFLCRTLSQGRTLELDDPLLLEYVRTVHPVVILDTAIRFSKANDENAAMDNQRLVDDAIRLLQEGARAVVGLHHATKDSRIRSVTLENTLRGTGDIAAMCDATYSLKRDAEVFLDGCGPVELKVTCVKARDFESPEPFVIAATYKTDDGSRVSYINQDGDFHIKEPALVTDVHDDVDKTLQTMARENPALSLAALSEAVHLGKTAAHGRMHRLGFKFIDSKWAERQYTVSDPGEQEPSTDGGNGSGRLY